MRNRGYTILLWVLMTITALVGAYAAWRLLHMDWSG
jgi:hypothetical protein